MRQSVRKTQPREVVTVCDHLFFFRPQRKHEIRRESIFVPLYRLVQCFGCHSIENGQIGINFFGVTSSIVNKNRAAIVTLQ
jgi:hypothetical protein